MKKGLGGAETRDVCYRGAAQMREIFTLKKHDSRRAEKRRGETSWEKRRRKVLEGPTETDAQYAKRAIKLRLLPPPDGEACLADGLAAVVVMILVLVVEERLSLALVVRRVSLDFEGEFL
ncbi:hypothetical protein E2C01_033243 [Portunus trituberculatus]|uniref:Uncharacterized protein n=1 Tax=Portunus trituberculatus TaxID=210409 RepID=A0A5B7F3I1_PORTR|nr:hypothetical protein [Portunus trituberculatus]